METNPALPFEDGATLRRLARALLAERGDADDVVQEAWLTALRGGWAEVRAPRAWLGGIVRRLVRQKEREEARRRRREARAAEERTAAGRADAAPADDVAARLELARRVVEAVEALEEPYRTAIALRFFDDLSPAEIAVRCGAPASTVRSHLARGLERLRARLDRDYGPRRRELLAVLGPLAGLGPPPVPIAPASVSPPASATLVPWSGALAMSTKTQVLLLGSLAAALAVSLRLVLRPAPDPREPLAELESTAGAALAETADAADAPAEAPEQADDGAEATEAARVAFVPPDAAPAAPAAWTYVGRAVKPDGASVAGITLELQLWLGYDARGEPARRTSVVTGADGAFTWTTPAEDSAHYLRVDGRAEGWHVYKRDWRLARGSAPQGELRVTIHPLDAAVVGTVRGVENAPLAGATVETGDETATTDAEGRYRLRTTSFRDTIYLRARAPGHTEAYGQVQSRGTSEVEAGDLVLALEAPVRGRVLDEDGAPIAGASVKSQRSDERVVRTAKDGSFAVPHIDPAERYESLTVEKEGFVVAQQRPLSAAELAGAEVEVVLLRGVVLEGLVVDDGGAALEGAQVCLGNPPDTFPREDAWTDAYGAFHFPHVLPGAAEIWCVLEGFAPLQLTVDVGSEDALRLVLTRGRALAGRVTAAADGLAGVPLRGVLVYPMRPLSRSSDEYAGETVATDQDGRFRLEALPQGPLIVGFVTEGYARLELPLAAEERGPLEIMLEPAGTLAGMVVDGRTGAPLEAFRIRLLQRPLEEGEEALWGYGAAWDSPGMDFHGTGGLWSTADDDLEIGKTIAVEASAEGYSPVVVRGVVTRQDPEPEALVVQLFPASRVAGQVVDRTSGEPVAGALVRRIIVLDELGQPPYSPADDVRATTDAFGRFDLGSVPLEPMSLVVEREGWVTAVDGPFDVPPDGARVDRLVQLERGATVRARLVDADGAPLVGEGLVLGAEAGVERWRHREATTDASGTGVFEHVGPGTYNLSWTLTAPDFSLWPATRPVEVEDRDVEVELRLLGRAWVEGRLVLPSDASAADQSMLSSELAFSILRLETAADADPVGHIAFPRFTIARDGAFRAGPFTPGRYAFHLHRMGRSDWGGHAEVTVPASGEIELTVPLTRRGD